MVGRIIATVDAIASEFQRQASPSGTIKLTVGMVDRVSNERALALTEAQQRATTTGVAHAVFRDSAGHYYVAPVQFAGGAPFNWVDHPVAMQSMRIQPTNGVLTAVVGANNIVDFAR